MVDPTQTYEAYFVEAGDERRFILRDEDGALEAKKPLVRVLAPGTMERWWAKFPRLDSGVRSLDITIPPAPRFHAVSVTEY